MLCEPNTANEAREKPYIGNIYLSTNDIKYTRLEDVWTFMYVIMSFIKVFMR